MADARPSEVGSTSSRRYWLLASSVIPRGYLLLGREPVIIGRGKECTLPVFHDSVSRRHARVFRDGVVFMVEDLGSTNGTFVQGKPINRPTTLEHDSVIMLGALELRFLIVDATREELAARFDPRTDETDRLAPLSASKAASPLTGVFTRGVLSQVCQLIELNHHSGVLRIESGSRTPGILRFREGLIVEARFASFTAEKAAREILGLESGEYAFQAVTDPSALPSAGPLRLSAVAISLDILRQRDERAGVESQFRDRASESSESQDLALTQKLPRLRPPSERQNKGPGAP
jgi:hypothetical protein